MNNLPFFPVDILREKIQVCFEMNSYPETFNMDFANGLKSTIKYNQTNDRINVVAELIEGYNDGKGIHEKDAKFQQIVIYNNFCQFYWALSYSYTAFLFGTAEDSSIILNEHEKETAYNLFNLAMQMTQKESKPKDFFEYPNPHSLSNKENSNETKLIEITNDIYTFGMCFVLAHEYSHYVLSHPESTPLNEYEADCNAFLYMEGYNENNENYNYILIGIISALCTLIFLDDTMTGGESHPDSDDRIIKMIDHFDLDESHDIWKIPLFFLKMWCWYYEINRDILTTYSNKDLNDKDFYIELCREIKNR